MPTHRAGVDSQQHPIRLLECTRYGCRQSDYIAQPCTDTDWGGPYFAGGTGDNLLGTCGGASHGPGPRAALGNWSTYISKMTP
jgi:hypothetical protein